MIDGSALEGICPPKRLFLLKTMICFSYADLEKVVLPVLISAKQRVYSEPETQIKEDW